jgi:mRNA interferase MazF
MIRYKPGDVVLVGFPFTDLTAVKKRPALIISPAEYSESYGDVVILALTSRDQDDVNLRLDNWDSAGLIKETWIKPAVATIKMEIVTKKLGSISETDVPKVRYALRKLVSERYLR